MREFLVIGNVSQESLLNKDAIGEPVTRDAGSTEYAVGLFQHMPSTFQQFKGVDGKPLFTQENIKRVDKQVECGNRLARLNYHTLIEKAGKSLRQVQKMYFGEGKKAEERFQREFVSLVMLNAHIFGGSGMAEIVNWYADQNERRVSGYNVFRDMVERYTRVPDSAKSKVGRSFKAHSSNYVKRCFAYALLHQEEQKKRQTGEFQLASRD
jgi:hypothetical protein